MCEPDEITGESGVGQSAELLAEATPPPDDVTAIRASWRAPLPPPNALARYNDVLPGSAERILQMAEKQQEQDHNIQMEAISIERTVVVSDARRAYLGLLAGFIISVLGIGGGIYLIATGHDWAGLSLAGINLTSLVGVFVYGAKARRDEHNRNAENTTE